MKHKGITVHVYRSKYDCTLNGVSSNHDVLVLFGEGVEEDFESDGDRLPAVKLEKYVIFGEERFRAHPVDEEGNARIGMSGGNFIFSTDSRFREICPYPIPVHDRFEGICESNG